MYDTEAICEKIIQAFPDIGECGIDVKVEYDDAKQAYSVDLKKNQRRLKTYLEPEDADVCMQGKPCIGLGIQIAQLRGNIERM